MFRNPWNVERVFYVPLPIIIFLLVFIGGLSWGISIKAAKKPVLGESQIFNIDSSYDINERNQITAKLEKITKKIYFYVDREWWETQILAEKEKIKKSLEELGEEFENKIYPTLTKTFGSEWKPGIDGDEKITILIHEMKKEAGGYFNSADEYPPNIVPKSNKREMVYLNAKHLGKERLRAFLAHEFQHLITFNQKRKIREVKEEIWLNEARSEWVITLLNYDEPYDTSNLRVRVKDFLKDPTDSLTEWLNTQGDYGVINLFTQYLVDHYGKEILIDSFHSKKVGIPSLTKALMENGYQITFSQVFTDWTIANFLNNCSINDKYCYLDKNLKKIKIAAFTNFLPLQGESKLSYKNRTKNWGGNWFKIIGGKGDLKLKFNGSDLVQFKLPCLLETNLGKWSVKFLDLNSNQEGEIMVKNFGKNYHSIVFIPSIQSKVLGFDGSEPSYSYSWEAQTIKKETKQELIKQLKAQIARLKAQIAKLKAEIRKILSEKARRMISCPEIKSNLYYGLRNDPRVRCLQEFLKFQGPEIYPEGLVTGNFLSLTKKAVIRFQEKHAVEILAPLNFKKGTGFVGPLTRAKINQILEK